MDHPPNEMSAINSSSSSGHGGREDDTLLSTRRPSKQLKMSSELSSSTTTTIHCLPDTLLAFVCEYLAFPSRALFAVALNNNNDNNDSNDKVVVVGTSVCTELLDFADVEKALAMKLTDEDLSSVLICMDAKHTLKTLKLTNCMSIIGHGLQPLRQSTVLEQIDMGLVKKFESPDKGGTLLSESEVLPILQSIVDVQGSKLKHIVFPDSWPSGDEQSPQLGQFIESYSRHLNGQNFSVPTKIVKITYTTRILELIGSTIIHNYPLAMNVGQWLA